MQRDLHAMSATEYDLVVVGGGITGASVAWDAALRGLKVALLEKDDFAHATTAGSSRPSRRRRRRPAIGACR